MKLTSTNSDPENNMRCIILVMLFGMSILMGCTTTSVPMRDSVSSYTVTLERTACRGNCPVYSITIHGDGTVEYEGFMNTPFKGKKIGIISKDSISAMMRDIEAVNINDLQADYVMQSSTDMPSVIFTVLHAKKGVIRGKRINDYQGDATAPEALRILYNRIDSWYSIIQWQ